MGLLEQQKQRVEAEIAKSFGLEGDAIEKGGKRTGLYQDNSTNRAKHRVGQSYRKEGQERLDATAAGLQEQISRAKKALFRADKGNKERIEADIANFEEKLKRVGAVSRAGAAAKASLKVNQGGNSESKNNQKWGKYKKPEKKGMAYGKGGASKTTKGQIPEGVHTKEEFEKFFPQFKSEHKSIMDQIAAFGSTDKAKSQGAAQIWSGNKTRLNFSMQGDKVKVERLEGAKPKTQAEKDRGEDDYDAMDIAQFTGTRVKAVQDAIKALKLDVGKIYDHVVKSGTKNVAENRKDFVTAITGKMNNPMMKKLVKEFSTDVPMTLHAMKLVDHMDAAKRVSKSVMENREKNMPKEAEKPKMPKEQALGIAKTIMDQLGGGKFKAMTGAKNLAFHGDGSLTFKLPGSGGFTKQGINHVKISLNAMDTYDMTFGKIRAGSLKVIDEHHNIYNDQLRSIFTHVTGLHTSLGKSDEDDLEKGGEGSRGGKITGHTKSGKPIYGEGAAKKVGGYSTSIDSKNDWQESAMSEQKNVIKLLGAKYLETANFGWSESDGEFTTKIYGHKEAKAITSTKQGGKLVHGWYDHNDKYHKLHKSDEDELEKGKKSPIGTVSGKYKKVAEGKWEKFSDQKKKPEGATAYGQGGAGMKTYGSPAKDALVDNYKHLVSQMSEKQQTPHKAALASKNFALIKDNYKHAVGQLPEKQQTPHKAALKNVEGKSLGDSLAKLGLKQNKKMTDMYGKNKNLKLPDQNPLMERIPKRG